MAGISILVADDSITIQKVIGIIFGSDEYSLTVVDNGKAAVQKALEIKPDVLLIDALMPGMSGYEVCETLRKDPELATKPVLLLTGSFEPFDEDKARQCGADDHIVKPFESQQIVAKVKELYELGRNRASGAAAATAPEPPPAEEPFAFEPTSFASPAVSEAPAAPEPSYSFQTEPAQEAFEPFSVPPQEEAAPVRSPDDPWGAFTQQPEPAMEQPAAFAAAEEQPDVLSLIREETAPAPLAEQDNNHVGASWVPVEEQTFEFREEVAFTPAAPFEAETAPAFEPTSAAGVFAEPAAPAFEAPADVFSSAFEPTTMPEPVVEELAEPPIQAIAPVAAPETALAAAPAAAVALSEEQLKAALLSASRETIERIVWEVVPDLAEAMIKEAIKRITQEA